MENASKALIIAGAILLSILLIGLGVMIFTSAKDVTDSMNMNDQAIQAFNSKFEAYEGTSVSGTDVRALIDLVRTHNNSYSEDVSRQVNIKASAASETGDRTDAVAAQYSTLKSAVKSAYKYTVTITYNAKSGLVDEIGFEKN